MSATDKEVNVFNRTRFKIDGASIGKNILYIWENFFPRVRRGWVNFIFTGDNEIKKLNLRYLNRPTTTDVISFYYTVPQPKDNRKANEIEGEVFISVQQARRQSKVFGEDFKNEIMLLAVHGFLHVVGYRDYTDKQKKQMRFMEKKLLSAIKIKCC